MVDSKCTRNRVVLGLSIALLLATAIRFIALLLTTEGEVSSYDIANYTTGITDNITNTPMTTSPIGFCAVNRGDGICDDVKNTEYCGYDYGDCCLPYVLALRCTGPNHLQNNIFKDLIRILFPPTVH